MQRPLMAVAQQTQALLEKVFSSRCVIRKSLSPNLEIYRVDPSQARGRSLPIEQDQRAARDWPMAP